MAIETTKAEGYRKRAASGLHRIGVVAVATGIVDAFSVRRIANAAHFRCSAAHWAAI